MVKSYTKLVLADQAEPLYCDEIVREIPGKRSVVFGRWDGHAVVAKLFYEPKHAKRHVKRDISGVEKLIEAGIPTPMPYCESISEDKKTHVLLFERILSADRLDILWENKKEISDIEPLMCTVTIELATQHVHGILQNDLHFKNFLVKKDNIYTLDGGDISKINMPVSKKQSLDNLGLFFAQFGVGTKALQERLFKLYTKSRGWIVDEQDIAFLQQSIIQWNKVRWKKYQKKIMRNSTDFQKIKTWRSLILYNREYKSEKFLEFLQNPDVIFSEKILKAGRSSSVASGKVDNKVLVVKRYNIKNIFHWLCRCLRPTRAQKSWRFSQYLRLMGIPTPKPIAFIEKRILGLREKSYFIMEYNQGIHAGDYFSTHAIDDKKTQQVAERIVELFENLIRLNLTHGDLKATNILINQDYPIIIDLDGMREHHTRVECLRAAKKDIKRFMKNWVSQPVLYKLFDGLTQKMLKRI